MLTVLSVPGFTIHSFERMFECLPGAVAVAKPLFRQDRDQAVAGLVPLARTLAGGSGSRPPLSPQGAHWFGGAGKRRRTSDPWQPAIGEEDV